MNKEDTKLIAEFIGRKGIVSPYLYTFKGITDITDDLWYRLSESKFHSSWDWLMFVVEKIESLIFKNDIYYNVHILGGCSTYIISSNGYELVSVDNGNSKLNCVYRSVIEFIKWYNKQENV